MRERLFKRAVLLKDFRSDDDSREAYSFDASGLEGRPSVILTPRDKEQVRRILVLANQQGATLLPRGSGTGRRGGVVCEDGVIVDMRGFNRISRFDEQLGTVDVEAGVSIHALNEWLASRKYYFPLIPTNPAATLGGLAAQNHVVEESLLYGDYNDLVLQVEGFDGLGRLHTFKGEDVSKFVGKEGSTGIMVKLRLRVFPKERALSADILSTSSRELLAQVERFSRRRGLLCLEYLDGRSSLHLGLEEEGHLVALYSNHSGSLKDQERVGELRRRRKSLPLHFWEQGLSLGEEATLSKEGVVAFIEWCAQQGLPCYGHIGLGLLITHVEKAPHQLWRQIAALKGSPSGKEGYGRLKSSFIPSGLKSEVSRLKERYDYRGVMNRGVLT